jgi:hypothetical protein
VRYLKYREGHIKLHFCLCVKKINLSNCICKSIMHFQETKFHADQWPRGLKHELSSPALTLGSWVRIPLEAWMSVCTYSVFMLLCV